MSYFVPIDREEQLALVLALYILDQLGTSKPKKSQVLRFVKARGFIDFYDDDEDIRENGEPKWMNDLAWAREDIKGRGFLSMPEIGIWKITESGKRWIVEKAKSWASVFDGDPSTRDVFLQRCRRLNGCFFLHMIMLGKGEDITKKPNKSVQTRPTSRPV